MLEGFQFLDRLEKWKGGGFCLDPIRAVLDGLGNPQDCVKTIHIAGTNGKGSVCAYVSNILTRAGFRVGLTISPHLSRVNERIVLAGLPISDERLDELLTKIKIQTSRLNQQLSYHEALTIAAFLAFEEERVDYAVVEVGLGGRLDASNVITRPEVAAIVSIGYDHLDLLGPTLADVAREKAGIIKPNSNLVIGPMDLLALEAISIAANEKGAFSRIFGEDFGIENTEQGLEYWSAGTNAIEAKQFVIKPNLLGRHQACNASVAAEICKLLHYSESSIQEGINTAFWPGRLEVINYRGREIILDCAHNPDGIESLCAYLKHQQYQEVNLGFGVLESKDWHKMTDKLMPYVAHWHLLEVSSERALSSAHVAEYLSGFGISQENYHRDLSGFLESILKKEGPIVITGSIYLIGELRSLLDIPEKPIWRS